MQIHAAQSQADSERCLDFAAELYRVNPCWVAPDRHHRLLMMVDGHPVRTHARIQPFWVEQGGAIQATVTAVIDDSFNQHWREAAGHLVWLEAAPGAEEASRALLRHACDWLGERGCRFARLSFHYLFQLGVAIDSFDQRPTFLHSYNPPYYHRFIKNAGFATEKGLIEYRTRFNESRAAQYRSMVAEASRKGIRLRSWDFSQLERETALFQELYNETFREHWGAPQFTYDELAGFTIGIKDLLVASYCVFAEIGGVTAGCVFALPDLHQPERAVLLSIGVRERLRGMGVNLAMAASSYLAMIERGCKDSSYTVVLDDNWRSGRTAEKLGGRVASNFAIYRRDLV
ncbi:MAG: GNAT family N-acetyltransferase [Acidobacteria bacterium]|nr:GNAT family N-acetyltransferase [Acidobacteriota bacterium]